jgi:hypothetical protein
MQKHDIQRWQEWETFQKNTPLTTPFEKGYLELNQKQITIIRQDRQWFVDDWMRVVKENEERIALAKREIVFYQSIVLQQRSTQDDKNGSNQR